MPKKQPESNPFVSKASGFTIKAMWKLEKLTSGSVTEHTSGGKIQWCPYRLEVNDRASVYTEDILELFAQLSSGAKDMFMYVAAKLPYGKDYIELDEIRYCDVMKVAHATFFRSRKDLLNKLLVPRADRKGTYWVNPTYMFKGARMEKYPEAVVMLNDHPLLVKS